MVWCSIPSEGACSLELFVNLPLEKPHPKPKPSNDRLLTWLEHEKQPLPARLFCTEHILCVVLILRFNLYEGILAIPCLCVWRDVTDALKLPCLSTEYHDKVLMLPSWEHLQPLSSCCFDKWFHISQNSLDLAERDLALPVHCTWHDCQCSKVIKGFVVQQ